MNPFAIAEGEIGMLELPLRRPFITALGGKRATRNAFLRLRLRGGARGYGEASSSIVMRRHTPASLAAALKALARSFIGRDAREYRAIVREAWTLGAPSSAAAAFECALMEALLVSLGMPMAEWYGGVCPTLETDLTISAEPAPGAARAAASAAAQGFRALKVKVGGETARAALERVLAVSRAARGPSILLDGNQSMTPSGALALAEACLKRGVRVVLFEQPLPRARLKDMAALRKRSPVPIAADESVRSPEDALRVLEEDAADVLNVKVAKTGLAASLEIVALARAAGKKLMIGCMQESARGLSPSVHLALGTGAFQFVDLDSDALLGPGQPAGTFERSGPRLTIKGTA